MLKKQIVQLFLIPLPFLLSSGGAFAEGKPNSISTGFGANYVYSGVNYERRLSDGIAVAASLGSSNGETQSAVMGRYYFNIKDKNFSVGSYQFPSVGGYRLTLMYGKVGNGKKLNGDLKPISATTVGIGAVDLYSNKWLAEIDVHYVLSHEEGEKLLNSGILLSLGVGYRW